MAYIENSTGKSRYAHKTVRVDMTPMVDLGFLLITFFIFTTSLSEDKALKFNVPVPDKNNPMVVKCSKTITLIPGSGGSVGWVECENGVELPPVYASLYNGKQVRIKLTDKRKQMKDFFGDPKELFVIIKPDSTCSYQNLIDLIDEMTINEVTRYTIVDE
ncbi:MAG TPA: biopolymer transporter ExbD [Chitinophagaceae bacterium]|nr:biopolymer transporter ExbD [Chitinophagaceae bacterium]